MQSPGIQLRADGSITGIDALLDQISGSLGRQIVPMLREQIVPILQNDRELQTAIGRAAGREIAKPLWGLALIGVIYGVISVRHKQKEERLLGSIASRIIRPH
jgi:hypothetical protein